MADLDSIEPLGMRSLRGAIDMHVHSAPDVIPRKLNDLQLAAQGHSAGMRAIVLKNHAGSTSERGLRRIPDQDCRFLGRQVSAGFSIQEMERMRCDNPARLLGLNDPERPCP